MLEFCPAELSARPRPRVRVSLNYAFGLRNELLSKLSGMIILHKEHAQLLWNDIVVKKGGGYPLLNRYFKF